MSPQTIFHEEGTYWLAHEQCKANELNFDFNYCLGIMDYSSSHLCLCQLFVVGALTITSVCIEDVQ